MSMTARRDRRPFTSLPEWARRSKEDVCTHDVSKAGRWVCCGVRRTMKESQAVGPDAILL